MKTSGNTILITGGTSGIGLALAEKFRQHGNVVIVTGRSKERLKDAEDKGLIAVENDLTSPQDLDSLTMFIQHHYPQLNVLINNAGIQYNYKFTHSTPHFEKINKEIITNAVAPIHITHLLLPILMQRESVIINITSALGITPKPEGLVYAASKAALRNFTMGLRMILQKSNIEIIEIIPPLTETRMTQHRSEKKMSTEEFTHIVWRQLLKKRKLITVPKINLLIRINRLIPKVAMQIMNR